ncbi:hypothetical protein [Paraglaciecola sp.]|uniref:DUF6957 family protein n=1 Tax=Paraglaciecola sp. TaxID=1920173 RepID=UPI00273D92AB|nr:hypothetical protein [Paraglaciecola sp.]MDP5030693.1 hypothetical protein [Paraglaciecola sp.]
MAKFKRKNFVSSSEDPYLLQSLLDEAVKLQHLSSEPMESSLTLENFYPVVEKIEARREDKRLCIVSSWTWWDVINLNDSDQTPALSYLTSNFVIKDCQNEIVFGGCIKSSSLVSFEDGYLFDTKERTFILVGEGLKKRIDEAYITQDHFRFKNSIRT